jgi:hypothetical protein
VTALPHPQWRMMNCLTARAGKPATAVLERCNASVDDLIALHEREMVSGKVDDGEVDLGLLVHDRGLLNDYDVRVSLTAGGLRWVQENPSNKALIAVDAANGRRPVKLAEVAADAGVDMELFLLLEHAGLVAFSLSNGHDIQPVGTTTLRFYRNSLLVQLTAKAVEIIG